LGNCQWNIPDLHTLLEEILPAKTTFRGFEVTHEFPAIGRRSLLLNAREVAQTAGKDRLILLAIEDATKPSTNVASG